MRPELLSCLPLHPFFSICWGSWLNMPRQNQAKSNVQITQIHNVQIISAEVERRRWVWEQALINWCFPAPPFRHLLQLADEKVLTIRSRFIVIDLWHEGDRYWTRTLDGQILKAWRKKEQNKQQVSHSSKFKIFGKVKKTRQSKLCGFWKGT